MAFQSGTSTDYSDLLDDLVTFAVANGWSQPVATATDGLEKTVYLQGPGMVTTRPVYVQIRADGDGPNNIYWWEMRAAPSFSATLDFASQVGVSPDVYLLLQNSSIDYWFFVTDISIRIVAQVSTSYFSAYAGFYLPFANPAEYAYPLYVGASKAPPAVIFTTDNSGIRSMADPGFDAAWLRSSGGLWETVYNHGVDSIIDDFEPHLDVGYYTWPYYDGGSAVGTTSLAQPDLRTPPDDANGAIIIPVHLFGAGRDRGVVGLLEDVFWVSGDAGNTGAEQTLSIASSRAEGTLTLTSNPANSETVTIGTTVYTFLATLTTAAGAVLIGATTADSLENLRQAINAGPGSGVVYGSSTVQHPDVEARAPTATVLEVESRVLGTAGNSIATTETLANGSWGGATLSGAGANETYTIFPNVRRNNNNHFFAVRQS